MKQARFVADKRTDRHTQPEPK